MPVCRYQPVVKQALAALATQAAVVPLAVVRVLPDPPAGRVRPVDRALRAVVEARLVAPVALVAVALVVVAPVAVVGPVAVADRAAGGGAAPSLQTSGALRRAR